jgi:hypothetical protein
MMMMSVVLFMAGRLLQPRLIVHASATAPPFNARLHRAGRIESREAIAASFSPSVSRASSRACWRGGRGAIW